MPPCKGGAGPGMVQSSSLTHVASPATTCTDAAACTSAIGGTCLPPAGRLPVNFVSQQLSQPPPHLHVPPVLGPGGHAAAGRNHAVLEGGQLLPECGRWSTHAQISSMKAQGCRCLLAQHTPDYCRNLGAPNASSQAVCEHAPHVLDHHHQQPRHASSALCKGRSPPALASQSPGSCPRRPPRKSPAPSCSSPTQSACLQRVDETGVGNSAAQLYDSPSMGRQQQIRYASTG